MKYSILMYSAEIGAKEIKEAIKGTKSYEEFERNLRDMICNELDLEPGTDGIYHKTEQEANSNMRNSGIDGDEIIIWSLLEEDEENGTWGENPSELQRWELMPFARKKLAVIPEWATHKDIHEILDEYCMDRSDLAERFGIPYKTVCNWVTSGSEHRDCPQYVLDMMDEILRED